MTNLPRFALSAKAQEWMQLAPELVGQFREVPQVNHEPPETFKGLTWFVVVCNPKNERRAQLGLRRAGYQTYLPQTKRWIVHARKKEEPRTRSSRATYSSDCARIRTSTSSGVWTALRAW